MGSSIRVGSFHVEDVRVRVRVRARGRVRVRARVRVSYQRVRVSYLVDDEAAAEGASLHVPISPHISLHLVDDEAAQGALRVQALQRVLQGEARAQTLGRDQEHLGLGQGLGARARAMGQG